MEAVEQLSCKSHPIVAKYLKALEQGTFNPNSESFNAAWRPATAPEVSLEELRLLVLGQCRKQGTVCVPGTVGVSDRALPDLIRLLGRMLTHSASHWLFSLQGLSLYGWEESLYGSISLSFATACIFALPQLPNLHPLLFACKSLPGGAALTRSLWMHVATFLAPVPQQWWHRVRLALLLPCGLLRPAPIDCVGFKLLKPWRADLRDCYSSKMLKDLAKNGVPIDRDWEEGCHRSQNIPNLLASLAGMSESEAQCFGEVCIEVAVLAVGISLRLQEEIPVLLVGDFNDGSDLEIASLVGKILRLSHEVTTAEQLASGERQPCVNSSQLVLVRCSRNALQRVEELHLVESRILQWCSGVSLALASLHYGEVSALDLQMRLPPSLRRAVVFC